MSAQELITEHLDLWTGAVTKKSSSGRGSNGKAELTGVKKLREVILELAVRGLLTDQLSTDEPANKLIEKIIPEVEQLIKDGRFKVPKEPGSNSEVEGPFKIPQTWIWCSLDRIAVIARGGSPRPIKAYTTTEPNGLNWIKIGDAKKGSRLITEAAEKIIPEGLRKTRMVYPGDLILSNSMSFGQPYILDIEGCIHDGWLLLRTPEGLVDKVFLYYLLLSPYAMNAFTDSAAGAVVQNLNADKVRLLQVPLPPLEEQHRIVQKVDELMSLCDRLEQQTSDQLEAHETLVDTLLGTLTQSENATELADNWARLAAHFDTLFTTEQSIDKLKQTILQLAVMGRLVEQDAGDESATELLKKVAMEEHRLRTSGKFRRKRPTKFGTNQSAQQNLPSGWALAPLSELGSFSGGKTPSKSKAQFWGGQIPWVTPKDMKTQQIEGSGDKVTQLAVDEGLELFPANAVLFVVRSGILRRMFPTAVSTVPCTVNQDLKVLVPHLPELSSYIQLMMLGFEKFILHNLTKTGTTVESLKFEEFANCQFPIPPFQEQARIIKRVQELMALSDQLKERLNQANETRCQMAEAIVEQGLSA